METNAILAQLTLAQEKFRRGEIFIPTSKTPLEECGLDNFGCPVCGNKGYVSRIGEDGTLRSEKCKCMETRVSIRNLERSGLKDMIGRYRFDNYKAEDHVRRGIKQAAERFCEAKTGWFFISGKSGSGKTHICTAAASRLMEAGNAVRYMIWRDKSAELKSMLTDGAEYQELIRPLKRVAVLYVDDFLKGGASDADLRLAFEILNARYNDAKLRTIISTERSLEEILRLDEALGSRIYERSKGFVLAAPNENWRLKG